MYGKEATENTLHSDPSNPTVSHDTDEFPLLFQLHKEPLLYSVLGNRVHPHPHTQHASCPAHKSVLGAPPLPLAPDLGFTAAVMRAHTGLFQGQRRHIPDQITRNRGKSQGWISNLSIKQDTTVLGATIPIGIETESYKEKPKP